MVKSPSIFDRKVVLLLLCLAGLFVLMLLFGPSESLDVKLYYTAQEGRDLLNRFSDSDRQAYFFNELIDLSFISLYTSVFYISLKKVFSKNHFVVLLAPLTGFFDFVETASIIYLLKFSSSMNLLDWLGIVTLLKWLIGGLGLLVLVFGIVNGKLRKKELP